MDDKTKVTTGMSFTGCLALLFIALKLTGFISWSWVWVLSPIWIPFALCFICLIPALIVLIIQHFNSK